MCNLLIAFAKRPEIITAFRRKSAFRKGRFLYAEMEKSLSELVSGLPMCSSVAFEVSAFNMLDVCSISWELI